MKFLVSLAAALLALPGMAQTTCFTNADGATLCSTSGGVITGNTNAAGSSVYRDSQGRQLEFSTDSAGNGRIVTDSGEVVHWQQPVLGEMKYGRPSQPMASPAPQQFPALPTPSAQPWLPGQ